ncbi:hypothetical protein DW079_05045 [Segatella copri]|uniref:Uncharacterized protein n=1 Tax=Segatella copri TaxID=165179 RepID=A0A415F5R5_9BACT|nr:hypothetical protein DW079_05045 [Segatella copri]
MQQSLHYQLTLSELDEETKDKLESSEDFNDEAYDVFHDSEYVAQGVVMNNDALYNADTFSLTVKDEDDNESGLQLMCLKLKNIQNWMKMMKNYQYKTSITIHFKKVTI